MYIFIFFLGLVFGSFANVLIYRIPLKQSILLPFSYCPECKTPIKWYDNIPLISYLLLKGRCRICKEKISVTYPIVELLSGIVFTTTFLKFGFSISTIIFSNLLFILLIISFIDYKTTEIPVLLSYYIICSGIMLSILNSVIGDELFIRVTNSLIGGITGLIIGNIISFLGEKLFRKPSLGGGDIKLFSGIGTYLGFISIFKIIFLSSLITTVIVIGLYFLKRRQIFGRYIPFAPFISIATFIYIIQLPVSGKF